MDNVLSNIGIAMVMIGLIFYLILGKFFTGKEVSDNKEVAGGIFLVLIGHGIALAGAIISWLKSAYHADLQNLFKEFFAFIYLFQFMYVLPLIIAALIKRKEGVTKGALIAAGVTFLLSVITCAPLCFTGKW